MPYLADCEWDIFVSYAHDDKPSRGPAANWIVKFTEGLAVELNRFTGDHFRIYFDQDAQRFNEEIGGILDKVRRSGVFLMIGSPNFIASRWCRDEIKTFRETVDDTSRIFIAEIMGLRGRDYPVEVPNNLQARFWENEGGTPMTLTTGDRKYKLLIARMANQICERLEALKRAQAESPGSAPKAAEPIVFHDASEPAPRPVPPPAEGPEAVPGRAFVAYGREIDEEREYLVGYLAGLNVDVIELPAEIPSAHADFEALLDQKLGEASVFIQLLSRRPIRPLEGSDKSPTDRQLEVARERLGANDIFLWRPDDLDPERNPDEHYKALLRQAENPSVPELARAVKDRMVAKGGEKPPGFEEPLLLVINADPEDREYADDLMDACEGRDCTAILDDYAHEEKGRVEWADAGAVAFVQGKVPRAWLTARCIVFNRARAGRGASTDPKGQVILYAPPGPKAQVRVSGSGRVEQIDVSAGWTVAPFEQWLDKIGARRAGPD